MPDLVWQNDSTNQVTVNYFGGPGGATQTGSNWLHPGLDASGWHVVAVADFNRDGVPDLVWQNDSTRQVTVHYYGGAGGAVDMSWAWLHSGLDASGWHVVGAADFNGDGVPDLVWMNDATNQVTVNYYGGAGGATQIGWNWLDYGGEPGWSAVVPVGRWTTAHVQVTGVTPSTSSGAAGSAQPFTVHYTSPAGSSGVVYGQILFNSDPNGPDGNGACQLEWFSTGGIDVVSGSGTYCTLNAGGSTVTPTQGGYDVTVSMTFTSQFSGSTTVHQIYAFGENAAGLETWVGPIGSWTQTAGVSVSCSGSPDPATVGQTATFSATPSGGSAPYSYSWSGAVFGTTQTVTFQPASPGYPYTTTVVVTDARNASASSSCSVTFLQAGQTAQAAQVTYGWYANVSPVTRVDGNHVKLYAETVPYGINRNYVIPYIQTWLYRDGIVIASQPNTSSQQGGVLVSQSYTPTLEVWGPGTYWMVSLHNAWDTSTGQWMGCEYNCTNGLGYSWTPSLTVTRPTRPDYAPNHARALWYLGPGIVFDGGYTTQTLLIPGAANGAPESPVYFVTAGSDKLSLSCTNCTQPVATATGASGGCLTYDVLVKAGYGSSTLGYFYSDPFFIFINRPWNTAAVSDQASDGWCGYDSGPPVYSCAKGNGWETHVNYQIQGMCTLDQPMSGYDINEQFGGDYGPNYDGENWGWSVMPGGIPVYGTQWYDRMSISTPGSSPGDPGYCSGGLLCVPQFCNPGTCAHTAVDHMATQTWFVGSPASGSGARVQTNTFQRYTDSGFHTNPVTPKP